MFNHSVEVVLELIENDNFILTPDLLKPYWAEQNIKSGINTTGHCYAAAEAVYHLFGGKEIFTPHMYKYEDGESHWWLVRKTDGKIIDPTASQYLKLGQKPPYDKGKGRGFMQQSLRSQTIIDRIKKALK